MSNLTPETLAELRRVCDLFTAGKVIRMAVEQFGQFAEGNDLCKPLSFAFGFW